MGESLLAAPLKTDPAGVNVPSPRRPLFPFSPSMKLLCCLLLLVVLPGCSLFVMASKVLIGDPKIPGQFKQRTGINLIESEKTVLLVCTTPPFLRAENSAVDRDIIEGVYRRFRRQEIKCIDPNKVDGWLGRIGGVWDEPGEIAQEFPEADYIIHFEIDSISYREDNSPNFYRGNAHGHVSVYEGRGKESQRNAYMIFQHEFQSSYPNHYPIAADNMSERTFAEQYNTRVADELSRIFYDAPSNEGIY